MLTTQQVNDLSDRTQDAYSAPRYGQRNWKMIIRWLSKKGYDEQAIEAIIRSKYMRWAYDMSAPSLPGFQKFYKCVTEFDPRAGAGNEYFTPRAIDELIDGTFPPKNEIEAEARNEARRDRDLKAHMVAFAKMQYRARQQWCQENDKRMPKVWQEEYERATNGGDHA